MYTVVLIDDEFYFRKAIKVYFADWENQKAPAGYCTNGYQYASYEWSGGYPDTF